MKIRDLITYTLHLSLVAAIGQKATINFDGDGMELALGGSSAQIMCEKDDWPAVLRVCDDLAMDFGRVTGTNGSVTLMSGGSAPMNASMIYSVTGKSTFAMQGNSNNKGGVIIAGTIGNSTIIDQLTRESKIDVSAINGKWEAYVSAMVRNPMKGVAQAMVIAGELHYAMKNTFGT